MYFTMKSLQTVKKMIQVLSKSQEITKLLLFEGFNMANIRAIILNNSMRFQESFKPEFHIIFITNTFVLENKLLTT